MTGKWFFIFLLPLVVVGCGGPLPPPDPYNLAEAKDNLSKGNYWYDRGCYPESERYFAGGLESARLSDDVLLIIRAQNSLGAAALAQGELGAAGTYLEQALNVTTGHPDQPELDKVLGNLGALAFKMGKAKDAESFWKQAAEIAEERGLNAASYYCDLARLYLAGGRQEEFGVMTDRALAAAEEAALVQSNGYEAVLADALNLAGQKAGAAGETALAEERFLKALEMDRKVENTVGLAQDTESLGQLMIKLERYSEAAGYLDRAFFLWLAMSRDKEADRVLAELGRLSKGHKTPASVSPYQAARRNPGAHRLTSQCP